ncbi:MAG: hypothetical protein PHW34_10530 [Hespellia sp.]|nr:hypothetical protein [Hespellia sp.]
MITEEFKNIIDRDIELIEQTLSMVHIPGNLRIRSKGTERYSARN